MEVAALQTQAVFSFSPWEVIIELELQRRACFLSLFPSLNPYPPPQPPPSSALRECVLTVQTKAPFLGEG